MGACIPSREGVASHTAAQRTACTSIKGTGEDEFENHGGDSLGTEATRFLGVVLLMESARLWEDRMSNEVLTD